MMKEQFVIPAKFKSVSNILLALGLLTLLIGIFALNGPANAMRFWTVLLWDSVFFLMISVAITFLYCAATLAQGSWHIAIKRVMEAIFSNIPILGGIVFLVLMIILFGNKHIYNWADPHYVAGDKVLLGKSGFLNPRFFTILTLVTIGGWSGFSLYLRRISLREDRVSRGSTRIFFRTIIVASLFLVFYAVTSSTSAWHWLMSLDPHWQSTMYGWYVFSSSFVSGVAMLTLFVVALKNSGYLEWVTKEHLHDLGKFLFAFSIFWTYLWFAQYMLIWYGNISDETVYFQSRLWGTYRLIFLLNLGINFILPILILMSSDSKRNFTTMTFIAIVILVGHLMDFFMMIMPGTEGDHWHMGWFEIGITAGFVGLMIRLVSRSLARAPLFPANHPYLKETIIHRS